LIVQIWGSTPHYSIIVLILPTAAGVVNNNINNNDMNNTFNNNIINTRAPRHNSM